jgi:hypothetical protein
VQQLSRALPQLVRPGPLAPQLVALAVSQNPLTDVLDPGHGAQDPLEQSGVPPEHPVRFCQEDPDGSHVTGCALDEQLTAMDAHTPWQVATPPSLPTPPRHV